jgi:hypothetical protein
MCYGTLLSVLMGCQAAQPTTAPATPTAVVAAANTTLVASTEEPMTDSVETAVPTATSTPLPLPTETAMPTPLPIYTPTPDPVWSILFTGNACSKTATDCTDGPDTPPSIEYMIYSDGTGMLPLSEIEGIPHNIITVNSLVLSPDQSRVAFYSDGKLLLGDVGGNTYSEVATGEFSFSPHSFYREDPNCLAGFDEQKENGVITTKLYKSCIGDTEPTLIDTAVFPSEYAGLTYLLSPQGDKWLVYSKGVRGSDDETAYLYTKEIDDSTSLQPIFQKQGVSCSHAIHWQDNETIEFVYALCGDSKDRPIYFYVIDWEGKEITTRYELSALQEPPSESSISTNYYAPESGDWFADNNLFVFTISQGGGPTPAFNGLYILNLTTGETEQILSNYRVFTVRSWLPVTTSMEE